MSIFLHLSVFIKHFCKLILSNARQIHRLTEERCQMFLGKSINFAHLLFKHQQPIWKLIWNHAKPKQHASKGSFIILQNAEPLTFEWKNKIYFCLLIRSVYIYFLFFFYHKICTNCLISINMKTIYWLPSKSTKKPKHPFVHQ